MLCTNTFDLCFTFKPDILKLGQRVENKEEIIGSIDSNDHE
jgi:hypothetical protein